VSKRQRRFDLISRWPGHESSYDAAPTGERSRRSRGQAIVELIIILPLLLLIVMSALDMGRLFLGWVVLNNAARVGANYAAQHPDAWGTPGNGAQQATYSSLLTDARDDSAISLAGCDTATVPTPVFPNGTDVGDFAQVELACDFDPITPIIGDVFASSGNKLGVTARSVFPIRQGVVAGAAVTPPPSCLAAFTYEIDPTDSMTVHFTDTTPPTASSWIWNFGNATGAATQNPSKTYTVPNTYTVELRVNSDGTPCTPYQQDITVVEPPPSPDPSASPGASPSALPSPSPCQVPSFIGSKKNSAQGLWNTARFTTTVLLDPNANQNQNWTIQSQSLVGGQTAPCNASVTISPTLAP
jgi:PKD repeat protein